MSFRAKWIYPVSRPPIENGAFEVHNGLITNVGAWNEFSSSGEIYDLGDVVVMPGLINAHCHLDYTDFAGRIPPSRSFPDWVKTMLSFKAHWSYTDYAQSWLHGAKMCLTSGITTVVDIEAVPELLPEVWEGTPLRILSLFEMTGVKAGREPNEILEEALENIASAPPTDRCWTGFSPHAPYSTRPELLRRSAAEALERRLIISTHVAESAEEFEMFMRANGPFYDWLALQRNVSDCGFGSPVAHLARNGLLAPNLLAVHLNYPGPGDIDLLARAGTSVVHCPKSHEYFGHAKFAYDECSAAGVNICLGTDSLATARRSLGREPRLNLWDEMKLFAASYSHVSAIEIIKMVTANPARAIGRADLGRLEPGAAADFLVLNAPGTTDETQLCASLISSASVQSVYIAGAFPTLS